MDGTNVGDMYTSDHTDACSSIVPSLMPKCSRSMCFRIFLTKPTGIVDFMTKQVFLSWEITFSIVCSTVEVSKKFVVSS